MNENKTKLIINPEFRDKIPPLSEDEFVKLEKNILTDGEVIEPIVVWNNTIIDGHHRWKIIQKHNLTKYKIKSMDFPNKWAAIAWMCSNQLGRRNLTEQQRDYILKEEYDAQVKAVGAQVENKNAEKQSGQNDRIVSKTKNLTRAKIAENHGISESAVKRAVEFGRGLDEAEKVSPGIKDSVLSGEIKVPKSAIAEIRNMDDEQKKKTVDAIKNGKYAETKASYANTRKAIDDLCNVERKIEYTQFDLEQELKSISETFISQLNRVLNMRAYVFHENGAKVRILNVIKNIINSIKKMEGKVT